MANQSVIHICRSRSRTAEALRQEFEAWQSEHPEALAASEVEDWLAECVKLGGAALELFLHTRGRLRSNQLNEPQTAGECLVELFDSTLRVFASVQPALEQAKSTGVTVTNEAAYHEKNERLVEMRERLHKYWPWFNKEMWEATAVAIVRGDCQDVEEILRELQGDHSTADAGRNGGVGLAAQVEDSGL